MNTEQAINTFLAESRELLQHMESALLRIADEEDKADSINAIFRAAHTIKGSAGLFGLDDIVAFTHVAESVLDEVRDGKIAIDDHLIGLLLQSSDHIGALVERTTSDEGPLPDDLVAAGRLLTDALHRAMPGFRSAPSTGTDIAPIDTPLVTPVPVPPSGEFAAGDCWHISLRFGPDVLRNGMDPLSILRYLNKLGTIAGLSTLDDRLPSLQDMDPESCYLGFEIAFKSAASKAEIESAFEFVADDCLVRIIPPRSLLSAYVELIAGHEGEPARLGEILVECGSLTERELQQALQMQNADTEEERQPLGSILVNEGIVSPPVVEAALVKQREVKEHKSAEGQSVRVDAAKLDQLINLVGELITASASAHLLARRTNHTELQESNATLARLVEEVRDSALQLRMVKIGATFNRFRRVVRDVSREIGKDIVLQVHGEDTELDKTVVEMIGDPLTHLVRNAMDHGIETAQERIAKGKPPQGTLTLNAFHDSGSIIIEVQDDGGGLRKERILQKAIERGLVDPGRTLTDGEIYNLVFEPGFSTAEQVTNLSGRGVGMDVVKRNITEMRGSLTLDSQPDEGTKVTIRLPLTLAIIDGFHVSVGRSTFLVPLEMVEECVAFPKGTEEDCIELRGRVLPFVRLRKAFNISDPEGPRQNILVVRHGAQRAGLVVDALLGETQAVIKPLSELLGQVNGISGSSILGSGEVALILDVPALLARLSARPAALRHAPSSQSAHQASPR